MRWDRGAGSRKVRRSPGSDVACAGGDFGGPWTRRLAANDFAGFNPFLVDFCTDTRPVKNYAPNDGDQRGYGRGCPAHEAKDDRIPATPKVERPGGGRSFQATAADLEWRVGRIGERDRCGHWSAPVGVAAR